MIRKQPSLRILLATLMVTTALSACSSPEQRMERYTKSGQNYFDQGDYLKANLEFRNALEIDETHIPALQGLIDIAEQDSEYELMFGLLQRLIRLQPENVDALIKLGNIYLLASDEIEAENTADTALKIAPENLEAQALKASVLFKVGDRATALDMARSILAKDPANQAAVSLIVAEMASRNDYEGALVEVDKGLARDSSHVLLQLMKIELLTKLNRPEEVDQTFQQLIASAPEDPSYRNTYARNLIRIGEYEKARPVLADVVRLSPDTLSDKMNLIRIDFYLGGADRARKTFEEFIAARPDDEEVQFAYADFLKQQDDFNGAEAIYQSYAKQKKDEALRNRGRVELAKLFIVTERPDEARKLITEVLKVDEANPGALVQRAALKVEADELDSAIIDLRTALGNDPDDTTALVLMSAAFEKKGDIELANRQIVSAFEKAEGNPTVANAFAKFLIRNNEVGRAEVALSESLAKFPDNIEGLRLLAAARLSLQDWKGAEEAARLIEAKEGSDDLSVKRIMGTASIGQQNYAEAITQLRAANDEQPLSAQPLATLISAYLEVDRRDEARSLLKGMIETDPDNYDARILLARVYFSENNLSDAESALNDSLRVAPERIEAYDLLYRYYLRSGRRAEGFALIYGGLQKFPDNYGLKVFEADILLNEGRTDEAIAVYEELLARRPDDRLVANNYASLLSETRDDEASNQRALEAAQSLRDVPNPDFQDTVGWAYYKTGNLTEAIAIFEAAIDNFPKKAVLRYHLGAAYLANGQPDKARTQLEQSLELGGQNFRHADKVRDLLKQA